MATKKVIYFIAGPKADSTELAEIAKLNAATPPQYEVKVFSKTGSPNYGAGPEAADYVRSKAGVTVPSAYSAVPTIDPDAIPNQALTSTQAIVNNAQKITGVTGSGTVANIAVNPTTKAVTVTLTAS